MAAMTILIGTDEAGYGPNLGPLVIGATMWRVPDTAGQIDLYDSLAEVVCRSKRSSSEMRIAIADSKQLYKPRGSLRNLERGVLLALDAVGKRPATWRDLVEQFDPIAAAALDEVPWYAGFDLALPVDVDREDMDEAAETFREGLHNAGVALLAVHGTIILPEQFNRLVESYGSKGEVLSRATMGLTADLLEKLGESDESVAITCDKHGGRNRYAPLLQATLDVPLVGVDIESRAESRYRFRRDGRPIEITFRTHGEAILPTALASMFAKYIRELSMRAFNQFWQNEVSNLRPTAGYPGDAPRFKADIAGRQNELGIADRLLWRCR